MKIVLFDIDGTLLHTHGAGRRAMERAMFDAFQARGIDGYSYDGKTDPQIVHEQMAEAGIASFLIESRLEMVFDSYVEYLMVELESNRHASELCLGVRELLDALRERSDVTLGLLTGNIERGARHKLSTVGVDFDQFAVNAFGSDHARRSELPDIARRRAEERLGMPVRGEQLVIIGDTPADIHCGRALGVKAIGVATGRFSVDALATHDPAFVFQDFAETDEVLQAIVS